MTKSKKGKTPERQDPRRKNYESDFSGPSRHMTSSRRRTGVASMSERYFDIMCLLESFEPAYLSYKKIEILH